MSQPNAREQAVLEIAMRGILDDSLDAEDMARLKLAREHAADVLKDVENSPAKGTLKRDLNDNESLLAWAVDYLSDVVAGMQGTSRALSQSASAPQPESAAQKVPEGWVLVPLNPTIPMLDAGMDAKKANNSWADTYRAMLAAAPTNEEQR